MVRIPVFLSISKPFLKSQDDFLKSVESYLLHNNLEPQTLGRSEYTIDAPLVGIRKYMARSCGLITLAFRRTLIKESVERPNSDIQERQIPRAEYWLTSSYCHIEPAMALQLNLPVIIWRENDVLDEGMLDRGASGTFIPEFDLSRPPDLSANEWKGPLDEWIQRVKTVSERKNTPPN